MINEPGVFPFNQNAMSSEQFDLSPYRVVWVTNIYIFYKQSSWLKNMITLGIFSSVDTE